ncbi:unnamed protein product, partial [Amoebophrya sp. A25]
ARNGYGAWWSSSDEQRDGKSSTTVAAAGQPTGVIPLVQRQRTSSSTSTTNLDHYTKQGTTRTKKVAIVSRLRLGDEVGEQFAASRRTQNASSSTKELEETRNNDVEVLTNPSAAQATSTNQGKGVNAEGEQHAKTDRSTSTSLRVMEQGEDPEPAGAASATTKRAEVESIARSCTLQQNVERFGAFRAVAEQVEGLTLTQSKQQKRSSASASAASKYEQDQKNAGDDKILYLHPRLIARGKSSFWKAAHKTVTSDDQSNEATITLVFDHLHRPILRPECANLVHHIHRVLGFRLEFLQEQTNQNQVQGFRSSASTPAAMNTLANDPVSANLCHRFVCSILLRNLDDEAVTALLASVSSEDTKVSIVDEDGHEHHLKFYSPAHYFFLTRGHRNWFNRWSSNKPSK